MPWAKLLFILFHCLIFLIKCVSTTFVASIVFILYEVIGLIRGHADTGKTLIQNLCRLFLSIKAWYTAMWI